MQIYGPVQCHLTLNVRKPSRAFPSRFIHSDSESIKVIGWSLEWWSAGMSHLLFPVISLENLVKIGRYSIEPVSLPVAQIPHCFHSCLVRRTRLKVVGGGGWSRCDQLMCKDEKWEAKGINQYIERLTQPAAERKRKVITLSQNLCSAATIRRGSLVLESRASLLQQTIL